MSFFSKILNTLGFGSEADEYDDEASKAVADDSAPADVAEPADVPEAEQRMVRGIFDKVMDIVNSSLPDFLAKSVDPERQKQYMFDALDESMKAYILSLDRAARQRCEALWQQERQNLQSEMDRLKTQARQLEDKRSELKERQLSADRQKRALSERVHDLEAQVLKLEAEKEQYELENKGLINKAKVAAVLEKELEELRSASHPGAPAASDPELLARIEALTAEVETLKAEKQHLLDACEAAETKDKMEDSMLDELRKITAESKARVRELESELESMHKEYDLVSARLDDANARIQEVTAKDSENEVTHAQLEEISAQVERFAEVKEKLDHRIAQLKDNLQKVQAENESLRETIKSNLFQHATTEKRLREELDALRAELAARPEAASVAKPVKPRKHTVADADTSDVEDVITNTDFLTSAPDPNRFPSKEDTDFGYTAPPRKPKPDNKAQMSLFDE